MNILIKAKEARNKKINQIEKIKDTKSIKEAMEDLKSYASLGYDKITKEDFNFYFKCFGVFDKKKEHGDNSFMIRVRIAGGQLNSIQARVLGEVSRDYCDNSLDLTTRMQVELRYIKIENLATVLEKLNEVGLSTYQTGIDNIRNILSDPLDGVANDCIIESMPILKELQDVFLEQDEWMGSLPRKFNVAITGSLSNRCNIFGHDCSFVLANKNGEFGFNIYLGGKVGVLAKDINLFVTIDEVLALFRALIKLFKEYGYRDNRNKNRLYFLLQDVGLENFANALRDEAGIDFATAGQTLVQSQDIATGSNRVRERNGKYADKLIVPSGSFSGTDLIDLVDDIKDITNGNLRLTYDQNIYVIDIDKESLDTFSSTKISQKYREFDNIYFNDMIACAGTKTCSFGLIESKSEAIDMANFLKSEVDIGDGVVRMNWSACPKGCGVHGVGDIGFEGCKAKNSNGEWEESIHLFLGGKITREAKEGKRLHKALPMREAKHHVKYLLLSYKKLKNRGESFESFEDRYLSQNYSFQAIGFYTKINYILNEKLNLNTLFELDKNPKTSKREDLEIFDFGIKLFKLLTGEKRFMAVENFEPILKQPRHINKNEVSKLNPKVPEKLSEILYNMTNEDKSQRAFVFSELIVALKDI